VARYAAERPIYAGVESPMKHDFRVASGQATDGDGNKITVLECTRCGAWTMEPPPKGWTRKGYRKHVGVHETCEAHMVHEVMEA